LMFVGTPKEKITGDNECKSKTDKDQVTESLKKYVC